MRPTGQVASNVLRSILRRRGFATTEQVVAWSRHQYADPRYHLYPGLFPRIDRGKIPTVYRLEALRAATALTRRDLYALIGIDLDLLPLHSGALHATRTRPIQSTTYSNGRLISLPDRFNDVALPATTMPLSAIVTAWSMQPQTNLEEWRHDSSRRCTYVQIGLADGKSYPEIVPGMIVQVDPDDAARIDDGRLYVFEHPHGYSVCRAALEQDDTVVLLSSSRGLYPELRFHREMVRVLGRARACCGRITDIRIPPAIKESDLWRVYRDHRMHASLVPPLTAETRTHVAELLRVQRHRLGISYEEFAAMARRLREIAAAQFGVSAARLHELVHGRPTVVERPAVVYALAACFGLEFEDVLASLGIDVREPEAAEPAACAPAKPGRRPAQRPREHALMSDLLASWREWPPILSLLAPDLHTGAIFYFNQPIPSIDPLIKPQALLLVDSKQASIATAIDGRTVAELPDWERPIYMLLTRQGYLCGYCERDERTISIVSHPRADDQRRRTFAAQEVDVIGRVSGVATLL